MAVAKQNGDVIPFVKQKDYIMVNNDLGGGSFGKTVLLQDPFMPATLRLPQPRRIKRWKPSAFRIRTATISSTDLSMFIR